MSLAAGGAAKAASAVDWDQPVPQETEAHTRWQVSDAVSRVKAVLFRKMCPSVTLVEEVGVGHGRHMAEG